MAFCTFSAVHARGPPFERVHSMENFIIPLTFAIIALLAYLTERLFPISTRWRFAAVFVMFVMSVLLMMKTFGCIGYVPKTEAW